MTDSAKGNGPRDPRTSVREHKCSEDFHNLPHQKLQEMVANTDVGQLRDVAQRLIDVQDPLEKMGNSLKGDMARVEWEGEGADSFHLWGGKMADAVVQLAEYSKKVGEAMQHASDKLASAVAMPKFSQDDQKKVSTWLAHSELNLVISKVPPPGTFVKTLPGASGVPSQHEAYDAQVRMDKAHAEAAELMKALAESYNSAGVQITSAPRPNFPPMPRAVLPRPRTNDWEYIPAPSGRARQGFAPESATSSRAMAPSSEESGPVRPAQHARTDGVPARDGADTIHTIPTEHADQPPTHTHVDSGVITPPAPTTPSVPTSPLGGPTHHSHTNGIPVGLPLPSIPATPGRIKPGNRPVQVGELPPKGQESARIGIPGQSPVARVPQQSPFGPGRLAVPAPGLPADGIVGGRPTPRMTGQTSSQMPRGTVIGTEPGQPQGRPPMAYGSGGLGSPGAATGRTGTGGVTAGRRLASEAGGVVGGSPTRRPSVANRPFTPGGTGLVAKDEQKERRGGKSLQQASRPDFLVEEEATWEQGRQQVVPPVVD